MPNYRNPGSGTQATDFYRERKAREAADALSTGKSVICRSTDHAASSELCTEVIARLAGDPRRTGSNLTEYQRVPDAIHNLRAGNGHHKAQADHTGTNTCAQVLAAATS